MTFRYILAALCVECGEVSTYMSSSKKILNLKKNRSNQSQGSEDIIDSKSTNFRVIGDNCVDCRAKIFWQSAQIFVGPMLVDEK